MDDCIYRQAAIDMFQHLSGVEWNKNTPTTWANAYEEAADFVEALPSADVEPVRHGRWMERNPLDAPDCRLIECSECGMRYIVSSNIPYEDWISKRNYCVNCGARMDGSVKVSV